MNKLIYIILSVVLTVLVVSLLIWLIPSQQRATNASVTIESKKNEQINVNDLISTSERLTETQILERIKASQAQRKFITLDEKKLRAGILNKQMFDLSNVKTVSMHNPIPLTDEQKKDGRVFLKNDLYTLEGKSVGDKVEFNVAELGLKREATIERIGVNPHEDIISWSGYLEGGNQNSENFHITQTVKDNFTIGTINANGKSYSLLMKNGYGWVNDIANEASTNTGTAR